MPPNFNRHKRKYDSATTKTNNCTGLKLNLDVPTMEKIKKIIWICNSSIWLCNPDSISFWFKAFWTRYLKRNQSIDSYPYLTFYFCCWTALVAVTGTSFKTRQLVWRWTPGWWQQHSPPWHVSYNTKYKLLFGKNLLFLLLVLTWKRSNLVTSNTSSAVLGLLIG